MLCPECQSAAPGGSICPRCGSRVPEREIFGGQGGHYLAVLSGLSVVLFAAFSLIVGKKLGFAAAFRAFYGSNWFWVCLIISLLPMGIGFYYWLLLRDEEITVTDEGISRRSHWGHEAMTWSDVEAFVRQPILFRQTRLGRIAGLSRFFTQRKIVAKLPAIRYELVSRPDANGQRTMMSLEPGTIDAMDWLLKIIEERIGPPREA